MSNQFSDILPYLDVIRALPKLLQDELNSIIALYRLTHSINARNRLINHFLPLIPQLIVRHIGKGVEIPDLVQYANVKLIETIELLQSSDIQDLQAFIVTSINNHLINVIKHNSII